MSPISKLRSFCYLLQFLVSTATFSFDPFQFSTIRQRCKPSKIERTRKNGGIFQLISSSQKLKLSPFNWFFKCVFHPFSRSISTRRVPEANFRLFFQFHPSVRLLWISFDDYFFRDQELTSWRWILIQDFKSFSRFYSRFHLLLTWTLQWTPLSAAVIAIEFRQSCKKSSQGGINYRRREKYFFVEIDSMIIIQTHRQSTFDSKKVKFEFSSAHYARPFHLLFSPPPRFFPLQAISRTRTIKIKFLPKSYWKWQMMRKFECGENWKKNSLLLIVGVKRACWVFPGWGIITQRKWL